MRSNGYYSLAEDVWVYEIKRMARLVFEATKEARSDAEKLLQIRTYLNAAFSWGRNVGRLEDPAVWRDQ